MWTDNQKSAIEANCSDNLISAAAGSGKTAVMIERIVSRIINGQTDIDKILVVTFTNAAASEMKSRLMTSIISALGKENDNDRLNRQLMLVNSASICTIDSFCHMVLKNNFFNLGLEPDFKIADNVEIELLKTDILNQVFEDYYLDNDEVFLHLVDCYSTKNDSELFELILNVFRFTSTMPNGTNTLEELARRFFDNDIWHDYFITKAKKLIKSVIKQYDDAIENCLCYTDFNKVMELLIDEKNGFVLANTRNSWDELKIAVNSITFGRISFPKGTSDADKLPYTLVRERAKEYKKMLIDIFASDYSLLCEDSQKAYVSLSKIVEITKRFSEAFTAAKLEKGIVDFTDVEQMTLKLFLEQDGTQSELAKQLMSRYEEIYIDEYQDCNPLQEKLFSMISRQNCGEPNMFMVGDMKQSIYGFRGSEPKLFKKKSDTYTPYSDNGNYNKIILNQNFRSRKTIIDGVNTIFSQIMSEDCGELDYNEDEYLYYTNDLYKDTNDDTRKIDITLLETDSSFDVSSESDSIEELKKTEAEAIYVANKINELVNKKNSYIIFDKSNKEYRHIRFSDVVILLRSGADKAETFERIFTAAQIPSYCETGESYFDTPEISFLISLLKIIDNPLDDIAILSVMRHPVFNFDEDDFVSIRLSKPKGYFYNSVKHYISDNSDDLSARLKKFIECIGRFYSRSKHLTTEKLLWEIISDTEYMSYLSFLPNSDMKKANVNALISRAYDFEKTSYRGVFDFIRYIDSLGKNNRDVEGARILSEDENVVRIMTIHKSKGLEFPVVFLCDSSKNFNDNDITRSKVLMHREYGFGLNFYDYQKKYYYELPQKKMLKDIKRNEMLSEEMRVLYVALTRAREKLFIVGSERNVASKIKKLSGLLTGEGYRLSKECVSSSKSYMDWILLSLLRDRSSSLYEGEYQFRNTIDSKNIFSVELIHKNSLVLDLNAQSEKRVFSQLSPDKSFDVKKVLDFNYPFTKLSSMPGNMSVTELKRRENTDDDTYNLYRASQMSTPRFYDGENELTPAQIGTVFHLVMEKLDFTNADTIKKIKDQISQMEDRGFLTEKETECIDAKKILGILSTEIGKKMTKHFDSLEREFSFMYLESAGNIDKSVASDEKIVVQGTIDAFFEDDNGNLIIVDYKTDRVDGDTEKIKVRYAPQLRYYRKALENILGKKVSNAYLLLTDVGVALEC